MTELSRPNERNISEVVITPQSLLEDNLASKHAITEYEHEKAAGSLIAVDACSDARVPMQYFLGHYTSEVRSVSGAGGKSHLKYILNHPGSQAVLMVSHYDCGGLNARVDPDAHIDHVGEDVIGYVKTRIADQNPVVQACESALRASRATHRPIMAAVLNHQTGLLTPAAYYFNGEEPSVITAKFEEILEMNKKRVAEIALRNPDVMQAQAIQNPPLVTITTSVIPPSTRLSNTCGLPNSNFTVHLGYRKKNGDMTDLNSANLAEVAAQAQYPLANALNARSAQDPFGKTHTLLIETPRMEWSRNVAEIMVEKQKVRQWLKQNDNNKIIIAAIKEGMYAEMPLLFSPQVELS